MLRSIICIAAIAATPVMAQDTSKETHYFDFNYGDSSAGKEWKQAVRVQTPEYRSDVKGNVKVEFTADDMQTARVLCWKAPDATNTSKWGYDAVIAEKIDLKDGKGAFRFNADDFPYGPMTVRIFATNAEGDKDICELQLYNTGGKKWNIGAGETPPGATGMKLVFNDDFDGPLSISKDGRNARYNAHKPRFGDFSGWAFADPDHANKPFVQRDSFLKIQARKTDADKGTSGLIATVNMDAEGFWAKPPFYAECRFVAQSAIGTWPAFWTITGIDRGSGGDELDIVEAYGGRGLKQPNHPGYSLTSHFWGKKDEDGKPVKSPNKRVNIMELGGKSYWSTTFHTYGLLVTKEKTAYYFDDIEVFNHPTNETSLNPHVLLINYAIGGISGWSIDLKRYGDATDMYVDFLRVYQQE